MYKSFKFFDIEKHKWLEDCLLDEYSNVTTKQNEKLQNVIVSQKSYFEIDNVPLYSGDVVSFQKHEGYLLDSILLLFLFNETSGAWSFLKDNSCKDYIKYFALCSVDEIEHDILKHCKKIGNIFENPELCSNFDKQYFNFEI